MLRRVLIGETKLAGSDIDGLIRSIIVPSFEISGVISRRTPAKTELIVSFSDVVVAVPVDVVAFLIL